MTASVLRAVVCDDRSDLRRSVGALFERHGFTVEGSVRDLSGLLDVAGRAVIDVAVLSLPVAGARGLAPVTALRAANPRCEVVVLSAFAGLQEAVRAAGARALVAEEDLRALDAVLAAVVQDVQRKEAPAAPAQRSPDASETARSAPGGVGRVSTKPSA